MKLIKNIYWYSAMAVSITIVLIRFSSYKRKKNDLPKEKYEDLINELVKKWAKFQIKNTDSKINVYGEENLPQGSVLFVANHQSYFDFGLFLGYIPKNKGFVAKIETEKIPLIRSYMKELRCIFLDRKDLRQAAKTILEGVEILKDDYSLVIFPEGTRGEDGKMLPFKAGAFKLATKSKVPIVPVTIDGAYKIMPKDSNFIHGTELDITIHDPIYTTNLTTEEEKELSNRIYEIIERAITK